MSKFLAAAVLLTFVPVGSRAAGAHTGETGKITAQVAFVSPAGTTFTDGSGIRYTMGGRTFASEPKVYPGQYWGSFPLYFMGTTMNFSVTLSNVAAQGKKSFKVRVQAQSNVLETSGAAGVRLGAPQEWIVTELQPGQTQTLQGSVTIPLDPSLPSGLDITKIRISHLNEGSNTEAGLIKEEIAVWCPPPAAGK